MNGDSYTTESETERCPHCGKPILYGHTEFMGREFTSALECPCVTERKERERAELIAAGRIRAREYRAKAAGLSKRNRLQYFRNYAPDDGQKTAFDAARLFAKAYIEGKNDGTGLLLIGGVGSGKTHLAAAIINAILDYIYIPDEEAEAAERYCRDSDGCCFGMRFVSTLGLLEEIRASYDNSEDTQEIMRRYKTAKLLILDDMGAEKPTEWVRERLFDIIDYRYNECLPLIITTNATVEELRQRLGGRICDRIRAMCATYTVSAKSHRATGDIRQADPGVGKDFDDEPDVEVTPPFVPEGEPPFPIYEGDTLADVLRRGDEYFERLSRQKKTLYDRMRE